VLGGSQLSRFSPIGPCPKKRRVVHPVSTRIPWLARAANSSQAPLRHPESTPYRCFLPDLAGFEGFCRAGPSLQRRLSETVPRNYGPQKGIQSRYSGLRVQGTASSPFSTTRPDVIRRTSECQIKRRRGWDSNPRRIAPHTISNRAESAALAPLRGQAREIIASVEQIAKTCGLMCLSHARWVNLRNRCHRVVWGIGKTSGDSAAAHPERVYDIVCKWRSG
jgi:hypothetical protein